MAAWRLCRERNADVVPIAVHCARGHDSGERILAGLAQARRRERSSAASALSIPTRPRSLLSSPCAAEAQASAVSRASLASELARCCGSQGKRWREGSKVGSACRRPAAEAFQIDDSDHQRDVSARPQDCVRPPSIGPVVCGLLPLAPDSDWKADIADRQLRHSCRLSGLCWRVFWKLDIVMASCPLRELPKSRPNWQCNCRRQAFHSIAHDVLWPVQACISRVPQHADAADARHARRENAHIQHANQRTDWQVRARRSGVRSSECQSRRS
jgi:hypothetical protein